MEFAKILHLWLMLKSKQKNIKFIVLFITMLMHGVVSVAQTGYGSEKELKKKADGFFDKDDYVTCMPMYSQLLSIYPKEPEYNYRYGVCNLIAGNEKEKSIAYLSLAAKSEEIDKEVFYYLGRALHLNYRFDEAIANYNIFKTKASAKSLAKLDVNRQIEMCNNGKDLLRSITDLRVIDKNEFPISDYFRAYDLTTIDTRILVKPEDMQTPIDKKKNDQSVIVQKNNAQEIYYSSYGEDPKGSRDIYKIVKLPNYTFSKPIKLPEEINTPYDEEFPYITPDGKSLYFSSKGHNSMGGYDIFKSDYNAETGKYSKPINLDFAINTPDDDILYIYDGKGEFAYFSSKRSSGAGKVVVYKILNQRIPGTVAMVKGNFFTTDEKTHQAAKITLKNQSGTKIIGAYNVNPKTGDYQFMIRQGETYQFTVESKDFETMTREVAIPVLKELIPIKQKINLKHEGNSDLLTISTEIETNTSPELLQATMALLRERANLDVDAGPSLEINPTENNPIKKATTPANSNTNFATNDTAMKVASKNTETENKPIEKPTQNTQATIATNNQVTKSQVSSTTAPETKPTIASETKPTLGTSQTNKPSILTSPASKPEASPFVQKASLVAQAYDMIKKHEQDAIDFDLKSEEEKKKITEKNDSAKLVVFRIDELQGMTANLKNAQQLEIAKERIDEFKEEEVALKKGAIESAQKSEQYKNDAIAKRAEAVEQKSFAAKLDAAAKSNNQKAFEDLYYSKYPKVVAPKKDAVTNNDVAALQSKANELKSDLSKTNDIQVKNALNKQIAELNTQIAEKQNASLKSNIDDTQYPQESKVLIARGNGLLNESAQLKNEAEESRKNASTIGDPTTKNAELIRAANISKEARAKEIEAYTTLMQANAGLKKQMDGQISNLSRTVNDKTSASYTTANNLNNQAKDGFVTAQQARLSAASEPNQKLKVERLKDAYETEKLALQQQKRALETYSQLGGNSVSENNKPPENSSATKEEVNAAFEKTDKYPAYTSLNNEHKALEEQIIPKKAEIDTLKKTSQKEQTTATDLRNYAETLKNKSKKESALSAAVVYENNVSKINGEVVVKQKQVDSLQTLSNEKKTQADGIYNGFESEYKGLSTSPVVTNNTIAKPKSNVKPIKDLDYTQDEIDEILKKPEYLKYYQTRYLGDSIEYEYQKAFKEVENSKAEADKLIAEKEQVDKEYSKEKTLEKKQELRAKSKKLDAEITDKVAHADSLYESAEGFAKKIELADNKLQVVVNKLDDKPAFEFPLIYDAIKKKPFELTRAQYQAQVDAANKSEEKPKVTTSAEQSISNTISQPTKTDTPISNNATKNEVKPFENSLNNTGTIATNSANSTLSETNSTSVNNVNKSQNATSTNPNSQPEKVITTATEKTNNLTEVKTTNTTQITDTQNKTATTQNTNETNTANTIQTNVANNAIVGVSKESTTQNTDTKNQTNTTQPQNTTNPLATKNTDVFSQNQTTNSTNSKVETKPIVVAKPKSNVKPVEGLDYTQDDIDGILKSPNYLKYYRDKYNGDSLEYVYQKVFKQVESLKVAADKLYEERESLLEDIKLVTDPKKKQEMKKLAKDKEAEASSKIDEADMLYITAQELAKKIEESDKKLQAVVNKLTFKEADEFPLIYNTLTQKPFDKTIDEYNKEQNAKNAIIESKPELINSQAKNTEQSKTETKVEDKINTEAKTEIKTDPKSELANSNSINKANDTKEVDITIPNQTDINSKQVADNKISENSKNKNKKNRKNKTEKTLVEVPVDKQVATEQKQANKNIEGYELETETFEIKQQNAYTTDIPLDVAMPRGIIFRVQLGAYKRKVSADAFGGISPVSGETSKTGMIRYSAGLFKIYNNCNAARRRVNAFGFKDAFVIAFCNGKRIDVNLARKMAADGIDCESGVSNESIAQNNIQDVEPITDEVRQILATQKNLKQTEGLLYTVQVGVYKRLIATSRLYNLNDLYFDTLRKGLIRYTHGIFNDRTNANAARTRIVEIGIKDAFVIPYFNKRYIPTAEAERLIANDRNILVKENLVTKSTNTNNISTINNTNSNVSSADLIFKVQLGVFRNTVPVEIMTRYLKLANKGISDTKTTEGTTVYTIGNYSTLEEANKTKAEAIEIGVTDAFVTPYNKGVKITLDAAMKLLGK